MLKYLVFSLLLTVGLSQLSYANQYFEKNIVRQIDQNLQDSLDTLKKVVNINSGTMNFTGVRDVGSVFRAEFDAMGFTTQWIEGSSFNRAEHLTASYGTTGPRILMFGHLDTVFAKSDTFQSSVSVDDNHVAGPGITDMKGGDVIIISALRALKKLNLLDNVSIKVVVSRFQPQKTTIVDGAIWAYVALGFEDGDSNIETAVIARRGSIGWQLNVVGKAAHSSQIFSQEIGYGAIFEAARILNTFREKLAGVGNLTFNPGIIAGGTEVDFQKENARAQVFGKSNVVDKELSVKGGIRALTPEELQNAKKVMQKIVVENLLHTLASLVFDEGYPPMAPTEANYRLLAMYSEISESLGYGPVLPVNPRNAGAADISFAADHVKMVIDGLGLMGSGGHTKDEVADMTSFAKNIHKAAILIYRLGLSH
jgi:glutamate carboxypeptidase